MLDRFQKEYNTRINAIKDEMTDGETDFGPFFKAIEIFKLYFEEKIPIVIYSKLKQQVEKMMITKATMKIIDTDKFITFMLNNYMKYYINFNSPSEIIYNAWTLYERNAISMSELYITTELIKPLNILVDIPEEGKQTSISKDQFYALFTDHLKTKSTELIYSHQYKEITDNVDVFALRRVKKLFELESYTGSVNDFKQEFAEVVLILKEKMGELFKGKKWRQIKGLEDKLDYSFSQHKCLMRIHAIQKAIGVVNTTLLRISLTLLKQSLDFFLFQKRELLGGREDDDDEVEMDNENEEEKMEESSEKPKVIKRLQSKNEFKIPNEDTITTEIASADPKSALAIPSAMKSAKKSKRLKYSTSKKFQTLEKVSTPRRRESGVPSSDRSNFGFPVGHKSLSSQKTTFFGGRGKAVRKQSRQ